MTRGLSLLVTFLSVTALPMALAQEAGFTVPGTVEAGAAFTVSSVGSGNGTLYVIGPNEVLKKPVQLGTTVQMPAGTLVHAGHYLALLSYEGGTQSSSFYVLPSEAPAKVSFLAKPSRLPVDTRDGVTGAVYVFDHFGNLIVIPTPVLFQLSTPTGAVQTNRVLTRNGVAWTTMNTTAREGHDSFVARVAEVTATRLVHQVAGNPCRLSMSAHSAGQRLQLETEPVRDCSGNPVPDGTIVTFTETYNGSLSSADVPIKHGIAKVYLPAHPGSVLSVASGVVLGNQIRWGK